MRKADQDEQEEESGTAQAAHEAHTTAETVARIHAPSRDVLTDTRCDGLLWSSVHSLAPVKSDEPVPSIPSSPGAILRSVHLPCVHDEVNGVDVDRADDDKEANDDDSVNTQAKRVILSVFACSGVFHEVDSALPLFFTCCILTLKVSPLQHACAHEAHGRGISNVMSKHCVHNCHAWHDDTERAHCSEGRLMQQCAHVFGSPAAGGKRNECNRINTIQVPGVRHLCGATGKQSYPILIWCALLQLSRKV
jgi:hypothetical protein